MVGGLDVTIVFSGGAEHLVDNKKKHDVKLDTLSRKEWTLGDLLIWVRDNLIRQRTELFFQGDSVRPGILVVVNDTDWELLDTTKYVLQAGDEIVFISTLHGG